MRDTVQKVIDSGAYELSDVLRKVDVLWAEGKLSDDDRAELAESAREKSTPQVDGSTVVDILVRVQGLEDRVSALEGAEVDEYPEWEDGRVYREGDKMTWTDGERYVCAVPGETVATPEMWPDAWTKVE